MVLAVAGMGAWVTASAAGGKHSVVAGSMTVLSVEDNSYFNDVGPKGPSIGDTFTTQAHDTMNGKTVATEIDACTLGSPKRALCTFESNFFGKGKLEGEGSIPLAGKTFAVALTGGTGEFAGASGTVTVRTDSHKSAEVTFHVR